MIKFTFEFQVDSTKQHRLVTDMGLYWYVNRQLTNINEAVSGLLRANARELNEQAHYISNTEKE